MVLSCSGDIFCFVSLTNSLCYSARVLFLGCWVVAKVLLALSSGLMGAFTAQVAYSPPFFVDSFVPLDRALGGGGVLAMEEHLVAVGSVPVLGFFLLLLSWPLLGLSAISYFLLLALVFRSPRRDMKRT